MSRTLNLVDRLLATGRKLHKLGRTQDAVRILGRLANFGELPEAVAEETQARLAEIHLRRRRYLRARRHLAAALTYNPASARYHYLMATAVDADDRADSHRAAEHYRQSLALHPDQPRCLVDYGLLALELGQTEEGLKALRRAGELAPDDPVVVGKLAEGLRQAGEADEARRFLRAALFRHPRDRRFRKVWSDFQFRQLRDEQSGGRCGRHSGDADDRPTVLPFVRPVVDDGPRRAEGEEIGRASACAVLAAPHLTRPRRRSDQRHA